MGQPAKVSQNSESMAGEKDREAPGRLWPPSVVNNFWSCLFPWFARFSTELFLSSALNICMHLLQCTLLFPYRLSSLLAGCSILHFVDNLIPILLDVLLLTVPCFIYCKLLHFPLKMPGLQLH